MLAPHRPEKRPKTYRRWFVEVLEDRTLPSASPLVTLPLSFEPNVGQTDAQVQYLARGQGYNLYLTPGETVLDLYDSAQADVPGTVLRAQIVGANLAAQVIGLDQQGGRSNYYIGNDPTRWRTDVPHFGRVAYQDVYPGIDLVYYGTNQSQLEYDFVVAPGADPGIIKVKYLGAESMNLDERGNLILHMVGGDVVQHAPVIYQEIAGVRHAVAGSFLLDVGHVSNVHATSVSGTLETCPTVGFHVGAYDPSLPLIIDPILVYSTYHGGSGADDALDIVVENYVAYVTGFTRSADFPRVIAADGTLGGSSDAFVTAFNMTGTGLLYSTYFGGSGRENDLGTFGGHGSIALAGGYASITGFTQSADFPVTGGVIQSTLQGTQDAFVVNLNGGGALNFSTYLGGTGTEAGTGIAIDTWGTAVVVTGWTDSTNFPTQAAVQGTSGGGVDAFVTRINNTGTARLSSTYLGGSGDDFGLDVAVNASLQTHVTGRTLSTNFPTTAGLDASLGGSSDAFVTKYNAAGTGLLFSTYLGGGGDEDLDPAHALNGGGVAVDDIGSVYVTGSTASGDFPVLGPYDSSLSGSWDAFVAKLDSTGTPIWSTFLGGVGNDIGLGIAVDLARRPLVVGYTESADYPTAFPTQTSLAGTRDGFVTALAPTGISLDFSSYLGGGGGSEGSLVRAVAVDSRDRLYVAGYTDSSTFPTQTPRQGTYGGGGDGFIAKMAVIPGVYVSAFSGSTYVPTAFANPQNVVENGPTRTYTVVLTAGPSADVTITPNPDSQVSVAPAALTFTPANWSTAQTVTITAVDDALVESVWPNYDSGTITHSSGSADPAYNGIALPGVSVLVGDNDTPGIAIYGPFGGLSEASSGTQGYTVRPTSTPTADIIVTASPDAQTTVSPTALTFTPANWYVGQNFTLTVVDDVSVEGPHTGVISHSAGSADPTYNGIAIGNARVGIVDNDVPGISISPNTNPLEGAWTGTYFIYLNSVPSADVTINLNADTQVTVNAATVTLTPANWNVAQTVTVTAVDDLVVEANPHNGIITHTATSADTNYNGIAVSNLVASVYDNDTPGIFFDTWYNQPLTANVDEAGPTSDPYTLRLRSIPTANVVITITADTQISVAPNTVTFTPANWYVTQGVIVTAVEDGIDETSPHRGLVTHTASSGDPIYNGIALQTVTFSITDNDTAGVFVLETFGATDVAEGGLSDTYTIRLLSQPIADVAVTFNPGTQLGVSTSVLTFNASNWNLPVTVSVTAVDDPVDEVSPHTGTITHAATSADPLYNGIAIPTITAGIVDNDLAGVNVAPTGGSTNLAEAGASDTYTVVLNSQPTATVIVTLNPDAQVAVGPGSRLTFTAASWNVVQTVTLTAVDDFMVETSPHQGSVGHTVTSADAFYSGLPLGALTANITDNDVGGVAVTQSGGSTDVTEGLGPDTYTVVLTSLPSANVVITLSFGTQVTVSTPRLTFTPASWNTLQTVAVTTVDDFVFEGPHTQVITHTPSSLDPVYNGVSISPVTANITDNDAVGILQSGGSTVVAEGGATDTYMLVLASQPTADVVVTFNPGSQLSVIPASITFTPLIWNMQQTVTVQAVDDRVAENTHTGVISHASSSGDPFYNGVVIVNVTANITDNDTAGVIVTPSGGATLVTESSLGDDYNVVLNSQPTANVVISVNPDAGLTVFPAALTFTPANWNVAQTVFITAADNGIHDSPRTLFINHAAGSPDGFYQSIGVAGVTVTVNDPPGVTFLPTNGTNAILEGTALSYSAILHTPPAGNVILDIASTGQVTASPAQLVFTPADWNVPRPVTIAALDDALVEGSHLGDFTVAVSGTDATYNGLGQLFFTIGIVDNDGTTFLGTSRTDQIVVSTTAASIVVSLNNQVTLLPKNLSQLVIRAGDGNDSIYLNDPTLPIAVIGGKGVDRVFVTGKAGANSFTLDNATLVANGVAAQLWEAESLVISGQGSNDVLAVQNLPGFGTEFKGAQGSDQVVGPRQNNAWKITTTNGGTLNNRLKLNGVENWTGSSGRDSFTFSAGKSLTGVVDGGGGQDLLDYSAWTSAATVNLQIQTATGTGGFRNITQVTGGKGGADKLIGADAANLWNITAQNAGSVNGLSFAGFEHLSGGLLVDTFRLADNQGVRGKIDGGGGGDLLDYGSYRSKAVVVNLQARSATNLGGFVNLEQFHGGGGSIADTLIGGNLVNTWTLNGAGTGNLGGLGFDAFENLTGGSLADSFHLEASGDWLGLLSGGAGADTLVAFPGSAFYTGTTTGTLNGRRFTAIEVRR